MMMKFLLSHLLPVFHPQTPPPRSHAAPSRKPGAPCTAQGAIHDFQVHGLKPQVRQGLGVEAASRYGVQKGKVKDLTWDEKPPPPQNHTQPKPPKARRGGGAVFECRARG